jgi:hypothetical protein
MSGQGMSETVKTVATSIVDGLKASPVPTIVVVLNLAVLALVYMGVQKQADRHVHHIDTLMERCLPK